MDHSSNAILPVLARLKNSGAKQAHDGPSRASNELASPHRVEYGSEMGNGPADEQLPATEDVFQDELPAGAQPGHVGGHPGIVELSSLAQQPRKYLRPPQLDEGKLRSFATGDMNCTT